MTGLYHPQTERIHSMSHPEQRFTYLIVVKK